MIIRLIVSASALAAGIVVGWLWRRKFRGYAKTLYGWTLGASIFWGRAETFLNESAVLWFVFPTLDTLYEKSKDRPTPTAKAILMSYAVAILAFFAAVYSEKKKVELEKKEGG